MSGNLESWIGFAYSGVRTEFWWYSTSKITKIEKFDFLAFVCVLSSWLILHKKLNLAAINGRYSNDDTLTIFI
jgi:hypothetical protein